MHGLSEQTRGDNNPRHDIPVADPTNYSTQRARAANERHAKGDTYNCGDEGAVEIGVSLRAQPTPSLEPRRWPSACSSLPSARPTRVFAGGIRFESFPGPGLADPLEDESGFVAEVMIAERAMSVCWAIPAGGAGTAAEF